MDKKTMTLVEAMRTRHLTREDEKVERAEAHPMTGAELRAGIDRWNVPYTRAARWLGLSVDGLHKQMRGTHAISLQTRLLFDGLDKGFEITAIGLPTNSQGEK